MADEQTIKRYQEGAEAFIQAYRGAIVSHQQALILHHFKPKGLTLDVGCASGRDLSWLLAQGFRAEGLDAVPAFVNACRRLLPKVKIHQDQLPELRGLLDTGSRDTHEGRFDNLLVSAVLMHLPRPELPLALTQLKRLLRVGGRALISVRRARSASSDEASSREDGRLFTPLSAAELSSMALEAGFELLYADERAEDEQGKRWVTVVLARSEG